MMVLVAPMKPTIHNRLKQARIEAGYETATDAAQALNVPPGTYLGHENGTKGLRRTVAERYADFFRVRRAWLLLGEGTPTRQPTQNAPTLDRDRMREAICGTLSAIRKRGIAPTEDQVAELIFYVYDLEDDGEAIEKVVDFTAHRLNRR
jgi:DNA-binding XRE family transcriptional regulator